MEMTFASTMLPHRVIMELDTDYDHDEDCDDADERAIYNDIDDFIGACRNCFDNNSDGTWVFSNLSEREDRLQKDMKLLEHPTTENIEMFVRACAYADDNSHDQWEWAAMTYAITRECIDEISGVQYFVENCIVHSGETERDAIVTFGKEYNDAQDDTPSAVEDYVDWHGLGSDECDGWIEYNDRWYVFKQGG